MRIVALYKTWDCGEWIAASLASIYDHVDAIVLVHSEVSWLGETGNTCREPAKQWQAIHDQANKIHHVEHSTTSQEEQYAAGIAYIREHLPFDAVLAIDADEIWTPDHLERAKVQIAVNAFPAYRCNMHTYLKTPFYRVDPPWGSPTVLFREPELLTKSPRGCGAPALQLDNVWMHHYTYVRQSRESVERKLYQSCIADGDEVVVEDWMNRVYDRLPEGQNLHAFQRWREIWHCVRSVWWSDLPPAVRDSEIITLWWPPGLLMDGEQNTLFELALGRRQAVDLGTYCGRSAIIFSLAAERVHTVDAFEWVEHMRVEANVYDMDQYRVLHKTTGHTLESVSRVLSRFGNITCEQSCTEEAATRWPSCNVDFLFVDADHSFQGTIGNVEAWWDKLTIGSCIVLHDNNEIHPGVQQAVQHLDERCNVRRLQLGEYAGSLAAFEKIAQ